ncbi:MAG: sigma-54-dependent Fis family transcriptional regulator [Desulfobacteraceae bacterium]|nr:sigma-54-dependent Fis family transcriptional regulator [Desulfobacteraceae bacterium]
MSVPRLLIVDDEPETREVLSGLLKKSGYDTAQSTSAPAALEILEKEKYDLVITDMRMPGMTGLELVRHINRMAIRPPVVVITGYGSVEDAVEAMQDGAADYLLKPVSKEALSLTCQKVLKDHMTGRRHRLPLQTAPDDRGGKNIITDDPTMNRLLDLARKVAPSDATILIKGETGTGKELLAAYVHRHSGREKNPFLAMNCAALPEHLAESELFGHEKGAFTGAINRKIGKFELASTGTLLLDEISELSMPLQAKLLRVLQENEIDRIGGRKPISIDTRIIALSNLDLRAAVSDGKFREDLFYRINVVPLTLPPLRERKADIAVLAGYFLKKYSRKNRRHYQEIAPETLTMLMNKHFPGNIRELENQIERAVLIGSGTVLKPDHFMLDSADHQDAAKTGFPVGTTVREMEKDLITKTLRNVNENRTHAAKILGISIRTLRNKLKEYKTENPDIVENPAS